MRKVHFLLGVACVLCFVAVVYAQRDHQRVTRDTPAPAVLVGDHGEQGEILGVLTAETLGGATVRLGNGQVTTSNHEGHFTFHDVSAGCHTLNVEYDGATSAFKDAACLDPGQSVILSIVIGHP